MVNDLKPAATLEEHVQRLRARHMLIDDKEAEQWLKNVSYYRLSAYWYPARAIDPHSNNRREDFIPNTSFKDVISLYEADRKLRTLIHDGMERIEIAMRTQVVELLCSYTPEDPTSYLKSDLFREKFNHTDWISTAYGRLARAKSSESIKHYKNSYGGRFPLWVVAEVMDFRDISELFAGLKGRDQMKIAQNLNLTIDFGSLSRAQKDKVRNRHPLAGWMEQLTIIRNTCAHHGRLWNKSFTPASTSALRSNGNLDLLPESGQSERIFGALLIMSHLVRAVSPGTTWPDKIVDLLANSFLSNNLVAPINLGIPTRWNRTAI
ncbi:Abi family protein [Corynebacterium suicordis]|nr:Abi family protein [Corynebacterium suicordis]MDR6276887.1 abortive infection bacteriophage resistance protein [Corynebacterium suicordis]